MAAEPRNYDGPGPLRLLLQVSLVQARRRVQALAVQSRPLLLLMVVFVVGYIVFSFGIFHRALRFLGSFPGLGSLLIERLLFLLFAFFFLLLLFSNLVIGYTNLFRNRETAFLLTLPVSAQTIFRWKFLESTLLASWAFVFLIAPLLGAYGLHNRAPWHFYVMLPVLVPMFIVLPAVFGSWLAVSLARHMDRRSFQLLIVAALALFVLASRFWLSPEIVDDETLETRMLAVLDRLLVRTRFAQHPLLPSYWLSTSVLSWLEGAMSAAGFFMLVLLSHVLFFGFLAFTWMGPFFYEAASTAQSRASVFGQWEWFRQWRARKSAFHFSSGFVDKCVALIPGLRSDIRALIVKDVRMFWRDTAQWGQTLMLFGLLGVYIMNLRHFTQQITNPFWVQLISFLNLGACSLNLATLTTRFVFPQFSLEGKRVWIVGMAPLGLRRVVQTKFALATGASLAVTLGLVVLSCHMLKMPFERTFYFCFYVTVMTFSLNGLAMGMGVLYPNFKEDNPGKIVSGVGGTFCLVLSFVYIIGALALAVLGSPWKITGPPSPLLLAATWTGFALLSLGLGWLPLRLGLRRLERIEI